jgi:hypothetical protein
MEMNLPVLHNFLINRATVSYSRINVPLGLVTWELELVGKPSLKRLHETASKGRGE